MNTTLKIAKQQGDKNIRLYTGTYSNKEALSLYNKFKFITEDYNCENLYYDCVICSKCLLDHKIDLWNNKNIDISDDFISFNINNELLEMFNKKKEIYEK